MNRRVPVLDDGVVSAQRPFPVRCVLHDCGELALSFGAENVCGDLDAIPHGHSHCFTDDRISGFGHWPLPLVWGWHSLSHSQTFQTYGLTIRTKAVNWYRNTRINRED